MCYDEYAVMDNKIFTKLLKDFNLKNDSTLLSKLSGLLKNEKYHISIERTKDKTTIRFSVKDKKDVNEKYHADYLKYWAEQIKWKYS